MAAIGNLNTNVSALTTATTALTTAVATIPAGTIGSGGASEAQVQSAADAVAAQTVIVNAAVSGIQAAVTPPATP